MIQQTHPTLAPPLRQPDSTLAPASIDWDWITAQEPQLLTLEEALQQSSASASTPDRGKCVQTLLKLVEEFTRPLGDEAVSVAWNRLHRVFHQATCQGSEVE